MNINALTVTQVNTYIKAILDENVHLKNIYITGEISNFLHYFRSGHMYFTLKDETSQLKAVMFSSNTSRLKFKPSDGMRVLCRGRISVYDKDGAYQLYVDDMQPDGIGSLAIAFEQLKDKLSKEGLFDDIYKKPIPKYPRKIGVATSDMGAAIEDIKNITKRRYPIAELVIIPTTVQGDAAPDDICRSIKIFDSRDDIDVIIVGRGGGSLEDLWAFNTEQVARAVFECDTPVISAVGHETDFTICDFAADLRAPTPSAAAELCVPDCATLINYFDDIESKLSSCLYNKVDKEFQRLDNLLADSVLENPSDFINNKLDEFYVLSTRLVDAFSCIKMQKENELKNLASRLDALSPLKVISRGFALASADGIVVSGVSKLKVNDEIDLTFYDGKARCLVKEVTNNE